MEAIIEFNQIKITLPLLLLFLIVALMFIYLAVAMVYPEKFT